MLISLSNVLNLTENDHFSFFRLFWQPFCYHSNGKNIINTIVLYLCYCSNKPIYEKQFSFFGLIGGPKKPLNAHTPLK